MTNREWGQMGQNYLRGLVALGLQGFFIMICVAIYARVLGQIDFYSDTRQVRCRCAGFRRFVLAQITVLLFHFNGH